MNAKIAILNEKGTSLDRLARLLDRNGYQTEMYYLDEQGKLEAALNGQHWLAICHGIVDETAKRDYGTKAKGGLMILTASPDWEFTRKALLRYQTLMYDSIHTLVGDVLSGDIKSTERLIQEADILMHLPKDFFRNPDRYCNGCLEILASRWRGSRTMLGGNSPIGYELSAYDWGLVVGTTAEFFLNTGRYAIDTTLQHLVRPVGVACNEHGLKPEHHGFLNNLKNGTLEETRVVYNRFREMYKDIPLALEQIDGYDVESPLIQHLRLYRDTLKSGNRTAVKREQRWFGKNYPLTTPAYLRR